MYKEQVIGPGQEKKKPKQGSGNDFSKPHIKPDAISVGALIEADHKQLRH